MNMLWRLSREAIRYRGLYVIAILATLGLTGVNLAAPRVLSSMTGIVKNGVDEAGLNQILLPPFLSRSTCSGCCSAF